MPIAALATTTRPNSPFCQRPVVSTSTNRAASSPLKTVKTLARTISPTVRLVRTDVAFVRPGATRSATSAAVSPVDGVSAAAATGRRPAARTHARAQDGTRVRQSGWVRAATSSPAAKPCTCTVVAAPTPAKVSVAAPSVTSLLPRGRPST